MSLEEIPNLCVAPFTILAKICRKGVTQMSRRKKRNMSLQFQSRSTVSFRNMPFLTR